MLICHRLLQVGVQKSYAMHSLLGLSASHLFFLTNCPLVNGIAMRHRCLAIDGLEEAITTISSVTLETILAVSVSLSWQSMEWSVKSRV